MEGLREHLRIILAIFARDARRLVANPIACVIVAGACILPALYAWYTIAAFWDPYHDTEAIKVAVVDEDAGASSELIGEVNVGHEVVEALSENHRLGWQVVDEGTAMTGVRSGAYYAAIILPEDFSTAFVSVLDGHFKRPRIEFYVNEELTASGVKVAEAGASALEKSIDEEFVSTVSRKVIEMTQRAGSGILSDADEASGSLTRGVQEADDAIRSTIGMLDGLGPALDEASATIADGRAALVDAHDDLPGLAERLEGAEEQLGAVRSSLDAYAASVSEEVTRASIGMSTAAARASVSAGQASAKLEGVLGSVRAAIDEAERLSTLNASLLASLESQAAAGAPGAASAIERLEQENAALASTLSSLRSLASALETATASTDAAIQRIADAVESASAALEDADERIRTEALPKLDASLDDIAASTGVIRGALVSLEPVVEECVSVTGGLQDTLSRSQGIVASARASLEETEGSLGSSLTDLRSLQGSAAQRLLSEYLGIPDDQLASFLASPVDMHANDIYPVPNYGSGVAPFFTNLALWVAGFILMAIVRIRVDPTGLPAFGRVDAYFGRWLSYVVLGLAQGAIVCIGDLVLGVECACPIAFVGAGMLTAFVYVNLMYALAYSLRHIGKAIAVFVLILQIPGSSGMFPIEMMPGFYQALNPLLPFTYSIDAMREALGGFYGLDYLHDMLVLLLVFVPIGFLVGLVLGKYDYNLNILFDRKLGSTGLFVSEGSPSLKPAFRLHTVVRALLDTKEFRSFIVARAERFDRDYGRLARIGWVALFAMPVLMIVCTAVFKGGPDEKLVMLAWFFLGLLVVAAYLVCITFAKSDIEFQMSLAKKDDAGIKDALASHSAMHRAPLSQGSDESADATEDGSGTDGDGSGSAGGGDAL